MRYHQTAFTQPFLPAKVVKRSRTIVSLAPPGTSWYVSGTLQIHGSGQPCLLASQPVSHLTAQLKGWSQTLIKGGWTTAVFWPEQLRPFRRDFRPRSDPENSERNIGQERCQARPAYR